MDNYNAHKTLMLLNIKQCVNNKGGIGQVTKEAFHIVLKKQLKNQVVLDKESIGGKELQAKAYPSRPSGEIIQANRRREKTKTSREAHGKLSTS